MEKEGTLLFKHSSVELFQLLHLRVFSSLSAVWYSSEDHSMFCSSTDGNGRL